MLLEIKNCLRLKNKVLVGMKPYEITVLEYAMLLQDYV
jgi:hypothetical protein